MTGLEIRLVEFEARSLPAEALTHAEGAELQGRFRLYLDIDWPSPGTHGRWILRPRGVVGHLPLQSGRALRIAPKVAIARLWAILEGAYGFRGLTVFDGQVTVDPVDALFTRVVGLLADGVLKRAQRGLHQAYEPRSESTMSVRGSIDVAAMSRRPMTPSLTCNFEEHTADVDDNRLLAWTLDRALRGPLHDEEVRRRARRARHTVAGVAAMTMFRGLDCEGRRYTRLNEDYRPLHALCRFVLDALAPSERSGDRRTVPFLIDMARLFERFVARWLRDHLPAPLILSAQHQVDLASGDGMAFLVDLCIKDPRTGRVVAALDTKYKAAERPSEADVQQVVAYATALRCSDAFLVYPHGTMTPRTLTAGAVRVHTACFDLSAADLDLAGAALWSRVAAKTGSQA